MSVDDIIQEIKQLHGQEAVTVAEAAAQQLTDDEHKRFRSWNYDQETKRREALAAKHAGQAELIHELRESGTIEAPVNEADSPSGFTTWSTPGDDVTKMPMRGDRFAHGEHVWESLVDFNSWEPGAEGTWSAWTDITNILFPAADDEPTEYTDGKHYTAGDQVIFDGTIYEATVDHYAAPGWTPANAHGNWREVE